MVRIDLTLREPEAARDVALLVDSAARTGQVLAAVHNAMGVQSHDVLVCDGHRLDEGQPWSSQIRTGSVVEMRREPMSPGATVHVVVCAGPDAGLAEVITRHTSIIGRGPDCDVVLTDADVSRHHATLINNGVSLALDDCASTNGTWVDGNRVAGPTDIGPGNAIRIGNTVLRIDGGGTPLPAAPVRQVDWPAEPSTPHLAPIPLTTCVASVGGALAIGSFTHSWQFMAVSLLMPVVLLGGSLAGRAFNGRRRRRALAAHQADVEAAEAALRLALGAESVRRRMARPDPVALARRVDRIDWPRSPESGDIAVRVGIADQPADLRVVRDGAEISAGTARLVPVTMKQRAGVCRIAGPRERAVRLLRWMIVQLCVAHGPARLELALVVDAERDHDWLWARWLPHLSCFEPARAFAASARAAATRLVVVDAAAAHDVEDEALARCFPDDMIMVLDPDAAADRSHLRTTSSGRLQMLGHTEGVDDVIGDGISRDLAERIARQVVRSSAGTLTGQQTVDDVGLISALGQDMSAEGVQQRWQRHDGRASAVLGTEGPSAFSVDLCNDGPHALVAGTTGSGKSELLQTWVASLALNYPPDVLSFVLIDYKGGAAFGKSAELPHVCSVVTDLDRITTARALRSLNAELRRREALFAERGASSLEEYRGAAPASAIARLVIMVDEFAALAQDRPDFIDGLVNVAQRGRSLGVHLVLATQRPGGAVSADIRANATLRIALRVTDAGESLDVIGSPEAAAIPVARRGSAVVRSASGLHRIQVARVSRAATLDSAPVLVPLGPWRSMTDQPVESQTTDMEILVAAVGNAAVRAGSVPHPPPWAPALPAAIPMSALVEPGPAACVPFGIVDLPDEQRQESECLDLASGAALLFAGGPRSGRTTALATLAVSAATRLSASELCLYVIDAGGGALANALDDMPHVGTSVTAGDPQHVARLLVRLSSELRGRQSARADSTTSGGQVAWVPWLVLVDERDELSRRMEVFDGGRTMQLLDDLVSHGTACGISLAVSGDPSAATRLSSVYTDVYQLGTGVAGGFPSRQHREAADDTVAGRCTRSSDGAALQIALPAEPAQVQARAPAPPERIVIRPLPRRVLLESLPAPVNAFLLGVGGDEALPVQVDLLGRSARFLVAGPPSSGKSTVLASIFRQALSKRVRICVAADERSPLAIAARAAGLDVLSPWEGWPAIDCTDGLLLIDDIEGFVDRPAGDAIASVIGAPSSCRAVVASGDATALSILQRGTIVDLRRSRAGLLLQPRPIDGDLVGVKLSRALPSTLPGRGVVTAPPDWLLPGDGREPIPIQIAEPAALV